jgi:vrille protein
MMVAEFVARQQSGSPVNGETPNQNHNNSNMPAHSALLLANGGPMSPQSMSPDPENFPSNNYDLAAQLRKKELFSQRKQREFIPDAKKDESYWDRRRRNNEAAKRSREKRRFNDMVLEQRVVELTKENHVLKAQLEAIKDKYNICGENLVSVDQIMATLPTSEQVLSITKRPKLSHSISPDRQSSGPSSHLYRDSPSPVPTSVIHQNINASTVSPTLQQPPQMNGIVSQQLTPIHHPHIQGGPMHHIPFRPLHASSSPQPQIRIPERSEEDRDDYHTLNNHHPHPHHYVTAAAIAYNRNELSTCLQRETERTTNGASVLNLSRRAHSPYEVSSGGSSIGSADEEHDPHPSIDTNNSLPLKLRHKSHLGDKDAASALLALHNIKQEPNPRASPPWDGEGSSDERDSGISIGAAEWTATIQQRKIVVPALDGSNNMQDKEEENIHLKSQLARLESEVATIKNMMILNTSNGATAAAQ